MDLIVVTGSGPVPVEIKSAQTVTESFLKGLKAYQTLEPDTPGAFRILGGAVSQNRQVDQVRGYSELSEVFGKIDAQVV